MPMHPIVCISRVGLCSIDARWHIANRTSEFWRLYYNFMPGTLVEAASGRVDPGNGQVVIIPAGCNFSTCPPAQSIEHLFIHFTVSASQNMLGNRLMIVPVDDSMAALLGQPRDWNGDLLRGCALVYRALSLVLPVIQGDVGHEGDYAIKYIHDHLRSRLSIARMAHMAGCSVDHFIRTFARRYGTTPARYITQKRIEMAQGMLATTSATLHDIAGMCGFSSRTHLWSTFQRETGQTPSRYRALSRQRESTGPQ